MSRIEVLNDGGFRSDGRRQYELRHMGIDLAEHGQADGSAIVVHGLTRVLVSVFGPREARLRSQTIHDRAVINVELAVHPSSTGERKKRGRGDKRILDMAATIKSTFEPVIQTRLFPRSQIDVYIQVLQQDGGLLQTCINGTTLALMCAGIPVLDFVCAVTAGLHATSPLLDLTLLEENDVPNLTVAIMPRTDKVTLVTMDTRLHLDQFEEVFRRACEAGKVIHTQMKEAVLKKTGNLVNAIGSRGASAPMDIVVGDEMEEF